MQEIIAKTIVTRMKHGEHWFGADYNMNLYRGCNHGCIYCDSRSSCYGIEAFDTVSVKKNALQIVRDDLRRKNKTGVVATGAMSDPYNPHEKKLLVTRHALELIAAYGFGAAIATKSALVTRDIDVLQEIRAYAPVLVKITLTTIDEDLARILEPHAPPPSQRLAALAALSEAGIPTCVLLMPVLPYLTDTLASITALVNAIANMGVPYLYAGLGVTMRDIQREYYYAKLEQHYPGLKARYIKRYGMRYHCVPPNARALYETLGTACNAHGIVFSMPQIIRGYKGDYDTTQLSLADNFSLLF